MKKQIRIPLILLLAAISVYLVYDMSHRYEAMMLWGYRPVVLFLAAWGAIILAVGPWYSRYEEKWRWLGLSTLSGILLSIGFPDVLLAFPFFMFIGFIPLLVVEKEISDKREGASKAEVFKYAYHAFIVWNIITTYWVANTALVAGIFAITVNSALMCIPFVLFHQTKKVTPGLGYASFITYWIAFEYFHLNWELTWPWLTLGNSFAEFPSLIQWYEYTGVFGGSLWILLMNVLGLRIWTKYRQKASLRGDLVRASVLLVTPPALSFAIYLNYQPSEETVEVLVVQPNYEPHFEKFEVSESEQVTRYLQLTADKITDSTDYVVYPETSFGYVRTDQVRNYPAIERVEDFLRDYPGVKLITGLNAYRVLRNGEPLTPATRTQVSSRGDTTYLEVLNAAAQIIPGETEVQWYRKSKLVPGAEIFPYRNLLWFFGPVVQTLQGTWEGVGTQPERSVFKSPQANIGPVICYESIFGEYYTGYVKKGANAIFIMTNDGWWDNTAGHRQHLHFASLRAIETRRSIARSANTGISAFINQRGDIRLATRYDEPIAIRDDLRINDAITVYVKWGDIIARIAIFATVLLVLNTVVRMVTNKG